MRIFAVSDIHVDYDANKQWVSALSAADHRNDALILAGDVTDRLPLLEWTLETLTKRFRNVLFVPGNHDLWVIRDDRGKSSMQKFDEVCKVVEGSGATMQPFRENGVSIHPLLTWYDYSFGQPSEELRSMWMDYRACRWPEGYDDQKVTAHFSALNEPQTSAPGDKVITYSHFLPRIDLMPRFIPCAARVLYPILGSSRLDAQLRALGSTMHIYGHSHVNRQVTIDGVSYINNAFGYPHESRITSKRLLCVYGQ